MNTPQITLISTAHKENGKCNADELCNILKAIKPDVIFLEASQNCYNDYQKLMFNEFNQYHNRLELRAIQKLSSHQTFVYVPVLDLELSEEFDLKSKILIENEEFQDILNQYDRLEAEYGFQFLNARKQIEKMNNMREKENNIIQDNNLLITVNQNIDDYEHSMLRNIYSFYRNNSFENAVFMCGSAHRKTITEKIHDYSKSETINLDWNFYQCEMSY